MKPSPLAAMQANRKLKIIMKNSRAINFILVVLFSINVPSLFGQNFEPKKRVVEPDTTISSKIMRKDYQLYISFPRGYSTKDKVKYPVLYVLDGLPRFPVFNAARQAMDFGDELEKVIIVGIGSGFDQSSFLINRTHDYTSSKDTMFDRHNEKQFGIPRGSMQSGGAEKFLQCITTEIIPFIDKYCKTTSDRGITGHSLGGLFAVYCLLNTKGIFNRFGINSPLLTWNNQELLNQAELLLSKNETWAMSPTSVFISVGQEEEASMVSAIVKFSKLLKARAYKNASLTSHVFEGETHLSVIPANSSRTLSVLYGRKK